MATSGDISVTQDGGQGNVKLHPYFVTLVRWCMSCVWSTATVILHRLLTTPLQPITGPKPAPPRVKIPKRAAGTEHLHPEPRVECQLLHHPATHTLDVIFVHGLYGSLGNTWRQGDWRQKYATEPKIITLRDHSKPNSCKCNKHHTRIYNENKSDTKENSYALNKYTDNVRPNSFKNNIHNENKCENITDLNDSDMSFKKLNEKLSKKVIPEENDLITEQFYNNTLKDQVVVDNFNTQAKFVSDLFRKETDCDKTCEEYNQTHPNNDFKCNFNDTPDNRIKCDHNGFKCDDNGFKCDDNCFKCDDNRFKCDDNRFKCDKTGDNGFKCKYNEVNDLDECKCEVKKCEVGCGCICNECYSTCWPRDWIKEDFPEARVISINYTSDPYLWRPLWIKENKRLNLYQRAEQMMEQLLEMGVGEKPIIWVGHSKGGLFIKQIYCEAFEAYMKANKNLRTNDKAEQIISKQTEQNPETNGITAENIDTIIGHFSHEENTENEEEQFTKQNDLYTEQNDFYTKENDLYKEQNDLYTEQNDKHLRTNHDSEKQYNCYKETNEYTVTNDNYITTNDNYTKQYYSYKEMNDNHIDDDITEVNENFMKLNNNYTGKKDIYTKVNRSDENVFEEMSAKNNINLDINEINDNIVNLRIENGDGIVQRNLNKADVEEDLTSSIEECALRRRASLWGSSRGFMFYSVPHRGSPLADIKTPVTARSVDLLEIAKDCPLVLELQARWERAVGSVGTETVTGGTCAPAVHSVVETCRTLMSVLWLRIVSTDSADAGVGTLSGICVDHREICKPSSRTCRLYTTLTDLIRDALACTRRVNSH